MPKLLESEAMRTKLARSVLTRNLQIRPGERVIIEAWTHTLPWSIAFQREARRLGANPLVLYEDEASYWEAAKGPGAHRLGALHKHEAAAVGETDAYVFMWGPGDRARYSSLPPASQGKLFEFNEPWYDIARTAKLRGVRLEIGRPYPSMARVYGVSEGSWRDQVLRASLVDPARLAKSAAPIARALERGHRLRIRHENGTDLTLGLKHRRARSFTGTLRPPRERGRYDMMVSVPSGAVSVALDESVADGTLVANRSNYYDDGSATGAVLRFTKGRLTEASFATGEERFQGPYTTGGTGRDRPGQLRIGLNPELHNTPQLEDIERGAVLVSVGANRQMGGTNRSPFFGFGIVAGGRVEVDGRPLPI